MAPTKVVAAIVAKPFAIHHSSSPSFAAPRLLSAIPKALSISAATLFLRRSLSVSAVAHPSSTSPTPTPAIAAPSSLRRFLFDEPHEGTDIIVEALEREGIIKVFAYPDDTSMEIHQPHTRSPFITNHLLHHEQGEIFAASGYARSTSRLGISIATSGPGTLTWSPATLTPSSTSSPWSPSPASSGCPGPVLVDIPKDIQQQLSIPV